MSRVRRGDAERRLRELPDVRDGLTRTERIVLVELSRLAAERGGAEPTEPTAPTPVPVAQLYGRLVDRHGDTLDLSVEGLQAVLVRLGARGGPKKQTGE